MSRFPKFEPNGGEVEDDTLPFTFTTEEYWITKLIIPEKIIQRRREIVHHYMTPKRFLVMSQKGRKLMLPAGSKFLPRSGQRMRRSTILGVTTLKPATFIEKIPEIKIPKQTVTFETKVLREVVVDIKLDDLDPDTEVIPDLDDLDEIFPAGSDGIFIIPSF